MKDKKKNIMKSHLNSSNFTPEKLNELLPYLYLDFTDFLQRCIESPFSRKLDLWSYLDVPRSRLVKYPLLLRQVLKFSNATNEFAADMNNLTNAIDNLETIIRDVDVAMAQARAHFTVSRLEWLDEAVEVKCAPFVYNAKEEVISGTLRNNRGTVSLNTLHTSSSRQVKNKFCLFYIFWQLLAKYYVNFDS